MTDILPQISHDIWDMKYRFKQFDGTPIDLTMDDTWRRVAKALAAAEQTPSDWEQPFFKVMSEGYFSPAGRIISGAGTDRKVTLLNCFVMGTIPDSMSGIFDMLKEAALTMQQGGGIGYDFSTLRPKGAEVKGVGADASGPLTFMDVWDAMCRTVMSAGSRRGAMMATMRCDHPDIEAFIEAKRDPAKLRMFNMSVLVTDAFMQAVKDDAPWRLHFENRHGETLMQKTVQARDLWDKIMRNTYNFAEPGVIFIDRINAANNLRAIETISATNPCGEQPLPPYGACLLGSINLAKMVKGPFTKNAVLDLTLMKKVVGIAVRMMDNVIDVSGYPLEQQAAEARAKRRIGLGVTGLADALIMLGMTYGEDDAVKMTSDIMRWIDIEAYSASADLAELKGAYPLFSADEVLAKGTHASTMIELLKSKIRKNGLRNALLTSIAPTGTISLYAGNVSSGIEPVFALSYDRKVLQPDGSRTVQTVEDYAVALYREMHGDAPLPDYFVTAQTLAPEAHVRMQAAAQKWVDSSISKTVNCPEDIGFDDFKAIYELAYDMGCKGCTTYRPNAVTGSVLSVAEAPKKEEAKPAPVPDPTWAKITMPSPEITVRPDALDGATYKIKWPGSDHAIYVTISDIVENGQRRPFEVFINSKNMEHFAWTVALTRMISAVFRRPHDSRFVADELKAVFDPKGGAWVEGKYIPSVLAAIGGVIERHMIAIGYIAASSPMPQVAPWPTPTPVALTDLCPNCHSLNTKHEAGCFQCLDCGNSKCG